MKLIKEHIVLEKFSEDSDPVYDLGIGLKHKYDKFVNKISPLREFLVKDKIKVMCLAIEQNEYDIVKYLLSIGVNPRNDNISSENTWDPLAYAGLYKNVEIAKLLIEYGADLEKTMKYADEFCNSNTKKGLKWIKEQFKNSVNEKFSKDGDPIHDMNIGPQGIVYRCQECGSLLDEHNDILPEGEESERAKLILKIFGEDSERVKYAWCNSCQDEEMDRQMRDEYAREQQREWERQREEEERFREENDGYNRY